MLGRWEKRDKRQDGFGHSGIRLDVGVLIPNCRASRFFPDGRFAAENLARLRIYAVARFHNNFVLPPMYC